MTDPTNLEWTAESAEMSRALDEYLVVECQLGSTEAFAALVRRWHGLLVSRPGRCASSPTSPGTGSAASACGAAPRQRRRSSARRRPTGTRSVYVTGLAELEPAQRALLRLHYLEGRPLAEIAAALGVPEGTVKSRLHHARNQLRLCLEER